MQTLQAKNISLYDLEYKFGLNQSDDEQFFREWQAELLEVDESESLTLDRVKNNYRNLIKRRVILEDAVKMVILSPILDLAGFYQPPFLIETEASIKIAAEDEGVTVEGRIDILVLNQELVVLVIESKSTTFSLQVALRGRQAALGY